MLILIRRLCVFMGLIIILGVVAPAVIFGNSNIAGFPDNPNEMNTFPYFSEQPLLFTYTEQDSYDFSPSHSEDEWGSSYIDWDALENVDMRKLNFQVQLKTNEDIYNWMEPVYLTATITGSDLNVFPELRWRVQGLDTIADEGVITVAHGVGRSTARQILPNPYITHLSFYLYFPSGQIHVSTHPIEIGDRPVESREPALEDEKEKEDDQGKEDVHLPETYDPVSASLVGVLLLITSGAVFVVTSRKRIIKIKES